MEDQESTATDADELVSAVKTEEGMTEIVVGEINKFSRRNLPLSKLRKSLLVSQTRRIVFVLRPRKKKKLL